MEFKSLVYLNGFQGQREKRINNLIDFLEKWHAQDTYVGVHCINILSKINPIISKGRFKTLYLPSIINDINIVLVISK